MIRAILFDLDGTLLDSAPDFIHCLNTLLEQNDKTKLPDDVIRQNVSDGSIKLIEIGFKIKPSNNDFADLRRQLLDLYDKNLLKWADIFHDVENLINFVEDRPGHDFRYAIDSTKINLKLGWYPKESFESGLKKTIQWYINNKSWWTAILDNTYRQERLGVV